MLICSSDVSRRRPFYSLLDRLSPPTNGGGLGGGGGAHGCLLFSLIDVWATVRLCQVYGDAVNVSELTESPIGPSAHLLNTTLFTAGASLSDKETTCLVTGRAWRLLPWEVTVLGSA